MNYVIGVVLFGLSFNSAFSVEKGVYGTDNRKEIYEISDMVKQEQSLAVAAQVFNKDMTYEKGYYKLSSKKLGEEYPLCSDENYRTQLSAANCSGFLVAPNLLVTAGHCMARLDSCTGMKWIFDYQEGLFNQNKIPSENVYSCKKVLDMKLDPDTRSDYAVVQLDRAVVGREPLKYRRFGKIKDYSSVYVMGHPSGLPLKYSDDAKVFVNDNTYYFKTDLDTFGGNSGSPILNEATGLVEGILVRGDRDYVFDSVRSCLKVNVCSAISLECNSDGLEKCKGEDATRITQLPLDVLKIVAGNYVY